MARRFPVPEGRCRVGKVRHLDGRSEPGNLQTPGAGLCGRGYGWGGVRLSVGGPHDSVPRPPMSTEQSTATSAMPSELWPAHH